MLVDDAAALADWPGAELVVKVTLDRAFVNCPRYVHKMSVETLSEYAPCEDHTPPEPEWKRSADFKPYLPGARVSAVRRGYASNASGMSAYFARRYSPKPLAWPSWRLDAATPSSSRPRTTKLIDHKFGSG